MSAIFKMPIVWLIGDAEHSDFSRCGRIAEWDGGCAAIRGRGSSGRTSCVGADSGFDCVGGEPTGNGSHCDVEQLRRRVPLAGMVSLLGSWCEGETRTGRPVKGVLRTYWYDFPNWWRRQLALRAAGRCPDWARPATGDWHELSAGAIERGAELAVGSLYCRRLVGKRAMRWRMCCARLDTRRLGIRRVRGSANSGCCGRHLGRSAIRRAGDASVGGFLSAAGEGRCAGDCARRFPAARSMRGCLSSRRGGGAGQTLAERGFAVHA